MPYTALNFLVWTTTHHESAMFANLLSAPGLLPLVLFAGAPRSGAALDFPQVA